MEVRQAFRHPVLPPLRPCSLQPMSLAHFPFDSWDLLLALEFLDTSQGTHPGLTVHPSSGGIQLYT